MTRIPENKPNLMQMMSQERTLQTQVLIQDYLNQSEVQKQIKNMIGRQQRLTVNIDDLRQYNPSLAGLVLQDPVELIKLFQDQLNQSIRSLQESAQGKGEKAHLQQQGPIFPRKVQMYYVNFEGNFGRNYVTPRGLKADLMNQFVAVNGIVTRMSIVKPKIQTSVHYCDATKRGLVKHYFDQFNLN